MSCQLNSDATNMGDQLLESIATAYEFTPPQRGRPTTIATAPYEPALAPVPSRLPVFIRQVDNLDQLLAQSLARTLNDDIATNTINLQAAHDAIAVQLTTKPRVNRFARIILNSEADVTSVAHSILNDHLGLFLRMAYHGVPDQIPDRLLTADKSRSGCAIWEDEAWNVFEECAPQIVALANSPEGLRLERQPKEEHGRAIMYKLAVAMSDSNTYWGLLFGGDGALLFQRCMLGDDTGRYGLVCSEVLKIDALFVTVLGMMLVPGDKPLVDVAKWDITVPAACSGDNHKTLDYDSQDVMLSREDGMTMMSGASNLHVWFKIPSYEFKALQLSRSSPPNSPPITTPPPTPFKALIHEGSVQEHIDKHSLSPSPPVLLMCERMTEGATGIVFAGNIGSLRLIIKTIPPNHPGEADLLREHRIYTVLASLQGRVLPRMFGLFEGEGWTVLVTEHCGDMVEDVQQLSLEQREVLWQHAQEIHANGVKHGDLALRNVVLSPTSGELRIVDFAFSEVGHECEGDKCWELRHFRALLELP